MCNNRKYGVSAAILILISITVIGLMGCKQTVKGTWKRDVNRNVGYVTDDRQDV